ncbi:MAG: Crp/Fnr family transcriptional regulator [Anaerolineae bacterium]|nr:Crp/Fnr family transcriptional regulator [Anaerolineae bacterium]
MKYRAKQKSVPEVLIELREDDPEFKRALVAHSFRAGQTVAEPDVLSRNLFTLMKGRVQLIREGPNGRRLAIATLGPGAVFGEGALLGAVDWSVKAVALTDCIVWMVPAPQAEALAFRHPVLSWGLLQTVGQRLAQVENRMEEVAYKRLPERLAGLLLELANGNRQIRGTSHQSLADMLGTYRETISAILRSFKDEGLVELGYRKIELRDVQRLRLAAGAAD